MRKGFDLIKNENLQDQINFELHTYDQILLKNIYYSLVMIIGKINI